VVLGKYRIDAVSQGRLIEIQLASLAAIRDKVRTLLKDHQVVVVKPIIVQKTLIRRAEEDGPAISRRRSPNRGTILDLFHEAVHFTRVFPHERMTLEVPMIDITEWRYLGHGRRRRWRQENYQVEDQKLITIHETHCFQTTDDLALLVAGPLPQQFHTRNLVETL
jgi:hypothetical protein